MQLIKENLVLDVDFTKGHLNDGSQYGNDGAFVNAGSLTRCSGGDWGYVPSASNGYITIPDSPELQLVAGTWVFYGDFSKPYTTPESLIDKRDGSGTGNYTIYIASATSISIVTKSIASTFSFSANEWVGKKTIIITKSSGASTPKLYFDGVYKGSAGSFTLETDDAPLIIGNFFSAVFPLFNKLKSVLIYSDEKTAVEVAQIHAAVTSRKTTHKQKNNLSNNSKVGIPVSGAAWRVDLSQGKVIDQGANGYHGTIKDGVTSNQNGGLGKTVTAWGEPALLAPKKNGHINCGSSANVVFGGTDTVFGYAGWFKCGSYGAQMLLSRSTAYYFQRLTSGNMQLSLSGATINTVGGTTIIDDWHLYGFFADASNYYIYVNGEQVGSVARSGTLAGGTLRIGQYVVDGFYIDGAIGDQPIYRSFNNLAEYVSAMKAEYNRVAKQYKYRQLLGDACVHYGAQGVGPLQGTDLNIVSGTFKVTTDTVNGVKNTKTLECVTAGNVYVPLAQNGNTQSGTFDFWINPGGAGASCYVALVNSTTGGILGGDSEMDGYAFGVASQQVNLLRLTNGAVGSTLFSSAAGTHTAGSWKKYTLERKFTKQFTGYLDGTAITAGSGSNPVTDATYTGAKYLLIEMDAGDKIANISHRVGVLVS